MGEVLTPYQYSAIREVRQGSGSERERVRWRGKCVCGRRTHLIYSTERLAKQAIRHVHNADTETELHGE